MLRRITKKLFITSLDSVIIILSFSSLLLFCGLVSEEVVWTVNCLYVSLILVFSYTVCVLVFRIDRIIWRFASMSDYLKQFLSVMIAFTVSATISFAWLSINVPQFLTFYVAAAMSFGLMRSARFFRQLVFQQAHRKKQETDSGTRNRSMIIGGGWAGHTLTRELLSGRGEYKPVCILDDDELKSQMQISGVPVVGSLSQIEKMAERYGINTIIFAIPSMENTTRAEILTRCVKTGCSIKIVPADLVQTAELAPQTKNVDIEDLLGREQVKFDYTDIREYIAGRVCLVTGGGGSIGSELCRQIAEYCPEKLLIVDVYENTAYDIQQELKRKHPKLDVVVNIFSVSDFDRLKIFFAKHSPDIIVHAAAHKHVPLMEDVPEEAVKNNVVGTLNVCKLSEEFKAKKLILISTDKAVNPTNVMGATKRCCELIVKCFAQKSLGTSFSAVRFGNVLGSNGSVIPLFKKQIAEGGPVTVTDKRIVRYFMTIAEAVSLVLKCGSLAKNGELFVLDMGKQVSILSLAENLIKLSGLRPYIDIKIEETGLRPGEKMYEELLISGDDLVSTESQKIFIENQPEIGIDSMFAEIGGLIGSAAENDNDSVLLKLKNIIPNFHHALNADGKE